MAAARQERTRNVVYGALLLFAIVLPRVVWLDSFFIQDEHLWINRSQLYAQELLSLDLKGAGQFELSNHPAITTMTVVGPVVLIYQAVHDTAGAYLDWPLEERRAAAVWARLANGLLASVLLGFIFWGLRSLAFFKNDHWGAAVVTLMLSLEPWVLGVTRTMIVDTIMALLLALSIIYAVLSREKTSPSWRRRWVVASGVAFGLAFISKSPALIVLPVPLLLAVAYLPSQWRQTIKHFGWWWLGVFGAIAVAWPSFIIDPIIRLKGVLLNAERHTIAPEAYFWPGIHPPFFLFVLSTVAAVGCVSYVAFRWWRTPVERRSLLVFDAFFVAGLLFAGVLLSLQGDHARKNVPVLALLSLAGAGGWLLLLRFLRVYSRGTAAALIILQVVLALPWWPHFLTYHNPLLQMEGGKQMLVDVGNGSRLLAEYINQQPLPFTIATSMPGLVQYYLDEDRREVQRRLPGSLRQLGDDTTHIAVPASFPARVMFDPAAKTLLEELSAYTPETVIQFKDVPLFLIYQVESGMRQQ